MYTVDRLYDDSDAVTSDNTRCRHGVRFSRWIRPKFLFSVELQTPATGCNTPTASRTTYWTTTELRSRPSVNVNGDDTTSVAVVNGRQARGTFGGGRGPPAAESDRATGPA
ncbi:Hypothetical protein CINCED_3A002308 [Cinara cedri]|uniref:Uncharacterized protein n=1 Tax=Cinara cedri TaxID=506608 RepID=A0A5E4N9T6_9HEMI|nr:Hypothetical protein CINCED_3A002308 [Cinara cedri]